jgi:hypothetical protein
MGAIGLIEHVEAPASGGIPEPLEPPLRRRRQIPIALARFPAEFGNAHHVAQGDTPEGIHLHRLTDAGGDHLPIHLGIHPGELRASSPARNRPSAGPAGPWRVPWQWASTIS